MPRLALGAVLGAVLSFLLTSAPAGAAALLAPETFGGAAVANGSRSLDNDLSATGDALTAWRGGDGKLRAHWRPAGGAWGDEVVLDDRGQGIRGVVVEVGKGGRAVVAWDEQPAGSSGGHRFARVRRPDGTWTERHELDAGNVSRGFDVAIDAAGNVVLAWVRDSVLYTATRAELTDAWSAPETAHPRNISTNVSIAIEAAPDGSFALAYADPSGDPANAGLYVTERTGIGSAWGTPERIFAGLLTTGGYPRQSAVELAVGDGGDYAAAWYEWPSMQSRQVYAAYRDRDASTWDVSALSPANTVASQELDVAVAPNGRATAIWGQWYQDSVDTAVRDRADAGWSKSTVAAAEGQNQQISSLDLDAADGHVLATWLRYRDGVYDVRLLAGGQLSTLHTASAFHPALGVSLDAAGNGLVTYPTVTAPGQYQVAARGWDAAGPQVTTSVPDDGEAASGTSMSASATDVWSPSGIAYAWDFGDDSPDATGASVKHTYAEVGRYTVTVTATDAAGNRSTATDTIDVGPNVAPDVEITSAAYGLENADDVAFTWTVDDLEATVTCTLDGPDGHPEGSCAGRKRDYTGLADGDYTFTVSATDTSGLGASDSDSFTIDTVAPDTRIEEGPAAGKRIRSRTPSFTFTSAGETDPSFECRMDSSDEQDFDPCDDEWQPASALGDGEHTLDVRAVDAAGNADGSPASRTFVVDNVAPDASATAPAGPTNAARPTFTWSVTGAEQGETVTTTCRLARADDPSPPDRTACSNGTFAPAADLPSDGEWTFELLARDEAGNEDPAAASVVVDRAAPTSLQIDSGPEGDTARTQPVFTFSAPGEDQPRFRCRITPPAGVTPVACDDGTFSPAAPLAEDQQHVFEVVVLDRAGNTSAAKTRAFTVNADAPDTTAPDTRIASGPEQDARIEDRRPAFTFAAVGESAAAFTCRVRTSAGTAEWADCPGGTFRPATDLELGAWVFEARAADAAGNVDPSPATRRFEVVAPPAEEEEKSQQDAGSGGNGSDGPDRQTPSAGPPPIAPPPGFTPLAQVADTARMPSLTPTQSGGRWSWRHVERAKGMLAKLGVALDVQEVPIASGKAPQRSLRTQLRAADDAAGAVVLQDPPAGSALRSTGTQAQKVVLAVFDPDVDKTVQADLEDTLDAAERRRRRAGKKVPSCKYLMLGDNDLAVALGGGTPDQARAELRKEKCDFEVRYRKGAVADAMIKDVRRDVDEGVIELFVIVPIVSDFVITVREDPSRIALDDLTFSASALSGGRQEWTLTADRDQDNVFVATVQEAKSGRYVGGAKVELWAPGGEAPAFRGTTDPNGEVPVSAKLGTPGTHGLFVKVRDAEGDVAEGYRDLRVVERDEASFRTPTNRMLKRTGGRWRGTQQDLDEVKKLPMVPGNLGVGLAGATATTATVSPGPAEYQVRTTAGPGVVEGSAPMLELGKGPVVVAVGRGLILPGTDPMQVRGGVVGPAAGARAASRGGGPRAVGEGPPAQAAQFEQWALGWLVGAIVHRFIAQPRAVKGKATAAVSTPLPVRIPIVSDLLDRLAPAPVADAEAGEVVDITGATVLAGQTNDRALTIRLADGRLAVLAVSRVISTGGGNVISTGGGNVISTGGGNLTFQLTDGTKVGVISTGGGNVISTGGGNVISTGGGNVIATGGGNVISVGGGNVISTGGGNLLSASGGVISTGGGNLRLPLGNGVISVGGGNVISTGGGNVISTGGGNVISTGGGNVISTGGLN